MLRDFFPDTTGRVEQHTARRINLAIREKMIADAFVYAQKSDAEISVRIKQLDREWDTERLLEFGAGLLTVLSVVLGFTVNVLWFSMAGVVALFLLQHALQGWCPPLPIIRMCGFRTASEINEEKSALKLLRGDLDDIRPRTRSRLARSLHPREFVVTQRGGRPLSEGAGTDQTQDV